MSLEEMRETIKPEETICDKCDCCNHKCEHANKGKQMNLIKQWSSKGKGTHSIYSYLFKCAYCEKSKIVYRSSLQVK